MGIEAIAVIYGALAALPGTVLMFIIAMRFNAENIALRTENLALIIGMTSLENKYEKIM